ncbi:phosphodiester glycosidase family protein [bacterium]|nr:phosphodiester glycosidase family protein [bacterium]
MAALCIFLAAVVLGAQSSLSAIPQHDSSSEEPFNSILALRSSESKGKVRLVIETANAPDYQVYQQNEHLVIELFHTADCKLQPNSLSKSGFVRDWQVSNPALGMFRWDIRGRYALPAEQYRVDVLENPHRLFVDLYTQWTEDEHYQLSPGVSWHRRQYYGQMSPYLLWNQVVFDPKDEHITLDIALGLDSTSKCEAVTSIVARKKALVGINGGYFNMSGGALGLVVREGKIISPHVSRRPPRSAFAMTSDKKAAFARAKAVKGQVLTLDNKVWPDVVLALGGGPRLLANGSVQLTTDEEELGPKGNDITRSCGRTAVSADAKGRLAFSTASGYSDSHSQGITLNQMAHLLQRSGAVDAVNLDGGGSVDMSIQGKLAAHGPGAGTYERPVANALLIFDDRPATHPAKIDIKLEHETMLADGKKHCRIKALVSDEAGHPVADGTTVFFSAPGIENTRSLTVNGQAQAQCVALRLPLSLPVCVKSGTAQAKAVIQLKTGEPEHILARWYKTVKTGTSITMPSLPDEPAPPSPSNSEPSPSSSSPLTAPTPMFDFGTASEISGQPEEAEELETSLEGPQNGAKEGLDEPSSSSGGIRPPQQMHVIDFRARVIDKWYNGIPDQTLEAWYAGKLVGSYTTDQQGEVRATVQIPDMCGNLELRCAGLEPFKLYFGD